MFAVVCGCAFCVLLCVVAVFAVGVVVGCRCLLLLFAVLVDGCCLLFVVYRLLVLSLSSCGCLVCVACYVLLLLLFVVRVLVLL